jgi:aryl-alcohol dehydrogenase-like predicted oxidoreductase
MSGASHLGFGCVALASLPSPRHARDLLEGVFDLGIRHFDTAPVYGRGYSERLLGEFLRGRRQQVGVATKFGHSSGRPPRLPIGLAMRLNALRRRLRPVAAAVTPAANPPAPVAESPPHRIARAEVEASFDASRRALGTDTIDLYLLHEALPASLEPAALDFLLNLRAAGKVGQLGVAAQGGRYLALAPAALADWDVLQYEYGPAWPQHAELPRQFPSMTHVFHSCLRGVAREGNAPGRTLAACVSANPRGRVLFSSTNLAHIRDNVGALRA